MPQGEVVEVGSDVRSFAVGDKVYYAGDITRPGSNSEFQLVDERIVGKMPTILSFAEAAALPLTGITAWEALFERLGISAYGEDAGRSILIIGGAGGVGSIAIQLAKKLAKLNVIATASRAESIAWSKKLGADQVVNHRNDLDSELKDIGLPHVGFHFMSQQHAAALGGDDQRDCSTGAHLFHCRNVGAGGPGFIEKQKCCVHLGVHVHGDRCTRPRT